MGHKELSVSRHSTKRCKERLGISKKDTHKQAEKALKDGVRNTDTTGSLKRYMGYLYESHNREANNIILYNRDVYVFKDTRLITIFHLPNQYFAIYDKVQKRIIEGRNNNGK